jgi:molybdopterin/thiamine biosynthesis adenylyltransferase
MGCLQAAEALKLLVRAADKRAQSDAVSPQKLTLIELRSGSFQQLVIARNPDCPVCGTAAETR